MAWPRPVAILPAGVGATVTGVFLRPTTLPATRSVSLPATSTGPCGIRRIGVLCCWCGILDFHASAASPPGPCHH